MNMRDQDSSWFSLRFLRLETIKEADIGGLEALFKLSCSLCLKLLSFSNCIWEWRPDMDYIKYTNLQAYFVGVVVDGGGGGGVCVCVC